VSATNRIIDAVSTCLPPQERLPVPAYRPPSTPFHQNFMVKPVPVISIVGRDLAAWKRFQAHKIYPFGRNEKPEKLDGMTY